jgi:hypothetical protein
VNPVEIVADLRARQLATSVEVPAREDRATALPRIRHLLSQLKDTPEAGIDVETLCTYRRTAQATLTDARAKPERLLLEAAPRETPRLFRITLRRPIGRGGGRGGHDSLIDKTRQQVIDFYRDVVQGITPWRAAPARLPRADREPPANEDGPFEAAAPPPGPGDVGAGASASASGATSAPSDESAG